MPQKGDPVRGLPEQVVEFTFGGGLSEHEDDWLQTEGFQRLENCVQDKAGAVVKMPGYAAYVQTFRNLTGEVDIADDITDLQNGTPKLLQRGNQIAVVSGGVLSAKADEWTVQGRVSPFVAEQRTVIEMAQQNKRIDCCRSGDWSYTAWEVDDVGGDDDIRVAATYLPTGETVLLTESAGPTGGQVFSRPRIVSWDNAGKAILFYVDGAATLHYQQVTPDGLGTRETLETLDNYARYDVSSDPVAGFCWAVFCSDDAGGEGAADFTVRRYTIEATTLDPDTSTVIEIPLDGSIPMPSALAIYGVHSENRLAVAWWELEQLAAPTRFVPHLRAICLQSDPSLVAVWSERDVHVGRSADDNDELANMFNQIGIVSVGGGAGGGHYFLWQDENRAFDGGEAGDGPEFTTDRMVVRGKRVSTTGAVDTEVCQCGLVRMRSRPAYASERVFFLAEYAHQHQASAEARSSNRHHYILGINPHLITFGGVSDVERRFRPMGHFAYQTAGIINIAGGFSPDLDRMSTPFQDADGGWHFQGLELWAQGLTRHAVREYVLFEDERVGVSAELGAQTYIAGALLSAWDGLRVLEAGFLHEPFFEAQSGAVAGAPGLAAGTYRYKLTYARYSASGEILRSAPSAELAVESTGDDAARIATQSYIITNQMDADQRPVWLEIWRTHADEAGPFFLVNRINQENNFEFDGLDPNFRDQISYDDELSDGSLELEQLYSTGEAGGGELPNHPPTSALSLCRWRNRLLLTDGDQVLYSKEGVPNRAAEFNRAQAIQRATRQKLTAVAPLGEIFVLFGEDETGFIYGDGPSADGTGSTLTGPSILNDQVGCTQPAGLCVMPGGLLVPTRQGLQFLSLGREYSWIGAAIEDTLATYPLVRDARMDLGENRLWVCLASAESLGVLAVLDLTHRTWSTAFVAVTASTTPASIITVGSQQVWASSNNAAWYVRTPANYLKNGDEYQQVVETPWIKAAGLNGEIRTRRFWLLGERLASSAGLKIEFAYDFGAYSHTLDISSADLGNFEGMPTRMQLRRAFPRQRCGAVRLRITATAPADTDSAGIRFVSLRLAIALRRVNGRLLASRNAGGAFT